MDLLAHLAAYVTVCEERNFSRAAERLGIAQPLLSRRIKTLEQHFGGELFDRTRRQIETSNLGVLLLPHAKDVLSRAEHLRDLARSARETAVRAIGVPPDCEPAALARVIRAGAEHGIVVSIQELPADVRAARLDDGSLAFAVLRLPPETAPLGVPLGLASAETLATTARGRPVHLEDLRPRRGADHGPRPAVLISPEDAPFAADRLRKAAARAGLPEDRIRTTSSTATALAETLAGNGMLLCTEQFARRHQVSWVPLADATLHRGYELAAAPSRHGAGVPPDWLATLLAAALGTTTRAASNAPAAGHTDDARAQLAARG
ncbi:LysR family transcriptional regulator [Actinopolymorpha alba]|uniref:LysR family transcriptional regulator n=1 Tax=Actinopolymorpha alba TaxID=533267 RepID=UPI00035FE406|nr:LysR family transcriptional regulator [Actinopolymorpha alba]